MEIETLVKILLVVIILVCIAMLVFGAYMIFFTRTMSVVVIDIPPKCLTPRC